MRNTTYYTVLTNRRGFPVKFIDPVTCKDGEFTSGSRGGFPDPGVASQEFLNWRGHEHCEYLEPGAFTRKLNEIAADRAKLQAWNQAAGKSA